MWSITRSSGTWAADGCSERGSSKSSQPESHVGQVLLAELLDGHSIHHFVVKTAVGIDHAPQAALDLDSSLQTLMDRPGITGIPWYNSMFNAPSNGMLTVDLTSGLAGGHELCVDEVKAADAPGNGTGEIIVGGPNSWGESWGYQGRWYMKASDWWTLRKQQGDVYFWTPKSQPAPVPPSPNGPPVDADDLTLWNATLGFRQDHHVVPHIVQAAKGLNVWGAKKGLA